LTVKIETKRQRNKSTYIPSKSWSDRKIPTKPELSNVQCL
jgi:hypothetical protein